MYLAESNHAPFGPLIPLALFKTNPDGGGIVQTLGPLKSLADSTGASGPMTRRFLIVTDAMDSAKVVLRQSTRPTR